jgi:DNA-binding HxlR family transcriptional regulator
MGNKRTYGEACRFAYALDLLGERWALLVVRELLLGPKRYTDLEKDLPNVSPNTLSERLRELEERGIVRRRRLPPPAATWVYELTEWGMELEPVVTQLGAWGARAPVPPVAQEIGAGSVVLALRSLYDPEAAGALSASYALRLSGEDFHVDVSGGQIELGRGGAAEPEVTIEAEPEVMVGLLTGQLGLEEARGAGAVVDGEKKAIARFLSLFPMPEPCAAEDRSPEPLGAKA